MSPDGVVGAVDIAGDGGLGPPAGIEFQPPCHLGLHGYEKFGLAVSAYAFRACLSALLAAGFADRFDRKRMLLFFYTGFIIGTLWCG